MYLGIVRRIVALNPQRGDLAEVNVAGLVGSVDVGVLGGAPSVPGDFVLIQARRG